jgi:hypothetical protein
LLLLPLLLLELPQHQLVVLLLHRLILRRLLQLQHLRCHHRAGRPCGHRCNMPALPCTNPSTSRGHRCTRRGGSCDRRHSLLLLVLLVQQLEQVRLRRPLLLRLLLQLLCLDGRCNLLVLLLQLQLVVCGSPGGGLWQGRGRPCTASHGCSGGLEQLRCMLSSRRQPGRANGTSGSVCVVTIACRGWYAVAAIAASGPMAAAATRGACRRRGLVHCSWRAVLSCREGSWMEPQLMQGSCPSCCCCLTPGGIALLLAATLCCQRCGGSIGSSLGQHSLLLGSCRRRCCHGRSRSGHRCCRHVGLWLVGACCYSRRRCIAGSHRGGCWCGACQCGRKHCLQ